MALCEPVKYPPGLVALKGAIYVEFVFEDPFAGHHISMRWSWKKIPGIVGKESGVLSFHCQAPIRVDKSGPIGARYRR